MLDACKHVHYDFARYISPIYTLEEVSHVYKDLFIELINKDYCLQWSYIIVKLFLQSLRAKNNKSSCEALRLRTKLQGVNYPGLSLSVVFSEVPTSVTRSILYNKVDLIAQKSPLRHTHYLLFILLWLTLWGRRIASQPSEIWWLFCTMSEGRRAVFLVWGYCSALCQREDVQSFLYEVVVLHHVRGKTCSLSCMRLLFCTMSEGRRVVSSAQGRRAVSSLSGNASAVPWDLFFCQM